MNHQPWVSLELDQHFSLICCKLFVLFKYRNWCKSHVLDLGSLLICSLFTKTKNNSSETRSIAGVWQRGCGQGGDPLHRECGVLSCLHPGPIPFVIQGGSIHPELFPLIHHMCGKQGVWGVLCRDLVDFFQVLTGWPVHVPPGSCPQSSRAQVFTQTLQPPCWAPPAAPRFFPQLVIS